MHQPVETSDLPVQAPCPYCGRERARDHAYHLLRTCGAKACITAARSSGGKRGGVQASRERLLLLMRERNWTDLQARAYMDGWRAGARTAWKRLQRRLSPAA